MAAPGLFEVLVDGEAAAPRCALEEEYGAALLPTPGRVAVNFVSTLDGIVSYGLGSGDSRAVSGGIPADRLLMAMLRAVAGVIVVGAGTLRVALDHQWTPAALAPEHIDELAALRAAAGRPAAPAPLLVVSSDGHLPSGVAAVTRPDTPLHVVTPSEGADHVDGDAIVAAATLLGGDGPILCEGGPRLFASMLAGGLPIDLFLTVAPQLAGRAPGDGRRGLVEGVALPPFARRGLLLSVRRAGQHLLLRYLVGGSVA